MGGVSARLPAGRCGCRDQYYKKNFDRNLRGAGVFRRVHLLRATLHRMPLLRILIRMRLTSRVILFAPY